MLCIVASHYTYYGTQGAVLDIYATNFYDVLRLGGGVGVNCFVLASGYFMVNGTISMPKLARLIYQVISFASIISILAYGVGNPLFDVSLVETIKSGVGIQGGYWFINAYLVLMPMVPFLNILVHKMSRKEHLVLIYTLVGLCCILPEYVRIPTYCNPIGLFVLLYIIAAYIRLYEVELFAGNRLMVLLFCAIVFSAAIIYMAPVVASICHSEFVYYRIRHYMVCKEGIPVLIISLLMFMCCLRLRIGKNRVINYIAASTLGVYLFHEHPLMRDFIWQKCLHTRDSVHGDSPVLHCVVAISVVYIAGTIADIVWRYSIGRLYTPVERFLLLPGYNHVKNWARRLFASSEG